MKRSIIYNLVLLFLALTQLCSLVLLIETNDMLFAFLFILFSISGTIVLKTE